MPRPPNASTCRLASLAWDVIDEAYEKSSEAPIERTTLHKLALGYLQVTGFAAPMHVRAIWEMLGRENRFAEENCRQSYYGPVIHGIRERIEKGRRIE